MPPEDSRLNALRQSMPRPLVEKVLADRTPIEGERKLVTVLFTDVVSSTALAEDMDPEQYAVIINGAHRIVAEQVYRYEGTVAQRLGDGVLCFFGAPVTHEDDAERAVRAGLAILDSVHSYAGELTRTYNVPDFRMRIGINTGPVVVGKMGSALHFEYLAVGDTVNLAARMQSEADPGTVLLTQHTERLIAPQFELDDKGEIHVKGHAAPVHAYQVAGEKRGADRRQGAPGFASPMVGRQRELSTLKQLSENLRANQGGLVSIIGEAGLGKTRLIAEWAQWIRESSADGAPALSWAEGRCLSYGITTPYHLVTDVARSLLGLPRTLGTVELRAAVQERLEVLFRGDKAAYEQLYPYIAHLLSLPLEPRTAEALFNVDAGTLQKQYGIAITTAFRTLGAVAPTIIVLEDLHWADPQSVELLARLLPLATELPLLICLVLRPEPASPGWRLVTEARDVASLSPVEIRLTALSQADSQKLISNLLGSAELPRPLLDLVLSRSEGNPFFVEEVIQMLVEHGKLYKDEKGWQAREQIQPGEIPDTLRGVLTARIDQLPEDTRQVLHVASVIGREFPLDLLLEVLQHE